jgi:site-specific recombinase XerD
MEQKQQILMTDKLSAVIAEAETRMSVMGYSIYTQERYLRVWKALLEYSDSQEIQPFTLEYSQKFIEVKYGKYFDNKYSQYEANKPMAVLLDFIRLGVIIRQKNTRHKGFSEGFKNLFEGFLMSQTDRGLAKSSIATMRSRLHRLENFLIDSGIEHFSNITRETVNLYVESFISSSTSTASSSLREFGRLCDYAVETAFHAESFSSIIPRVKNLRRQRLPHTFTHEEIMKLLNVVDRSNPCGKRDYAMLLTTVRLGFRSGDVRTLKFSEIDWNKKTISIIQEKTGKFLELPIPEDVGWAIIDYMKNGRPVCDCDSIFVCHTPPYDEMSPISGNLVAKYMRKAGIKTPTNRVCGMHTLRHSLASGMLAVGVPMTTISSVLGHADINSTESYLRIDINNLRKCALEVDFDEN